MITGALNIRLSDSENRISTPFEYEVTLAYYPPRRESVNKKMFYIYFHGNRINEGVLAEKHLKINKL